MGYAEFIILGLLSSYENLTVIMLIECNTVKVRSLRGQEVSIPGIAHHPHQAHAVGLIVMYAEVGLGLCYIRFTLHKHEIATIANQSRDTIWTHGRRCMDKPNLQKPSPSGLPRVVPMPNQIRSVYLTSDWVNKPNPPRYLTSGSCPIRFYLAELAVDSPLSMTFKYKFVHRRATDSAVMQWLSGNAPACSA